ncbi:cytochrome c oxidase subunit 6A1, mitochondrial-like [Ylistrum balloti]|uniref:cytochrome c oxidase subunit 6A1, mitochondrial-like n=1 Tax=Ylistrum balloti TaxID=509963 RepID=UPI002905C964|nr:cytochrome c oxidase subunit 6A1, mitochondrial-like [Ylistrum balloti]
MALSRVGLMRQVLKNAVKRPANQPKRDCGYIYRPTESVKEGAHEYYIPEYKAVIEKEYKTSLKVSIPLLITGMVLTILTEEHSEERPEYLPYDYMYIRKNPFPWGDGNHSLFHCDDSNPMPDGWPEK